MDNIGSFLESEDAGCETVAENMSTPTEVTSLVAEVEGVKGSYRFEKIFITDNGDEHVEDDVEE